LHGLFTASQRLSVSVLPLHFYSPIPNVRELRRWSDWREPRSMYGVNRLGIDEQIALLSEIVPAMPTNSARGRGRHGGH
jgi:hypothetical protein